MNGNAGRWRLVLLLALVAAAVLWGGWKWWDVRRYRRAMAEIEEEIENGLHGTAARKLDRRSWLGNPTRMRPSTSWEPARWREGERNPPPRPGPGSRRVPSFAPRAILGSMQIQMERGQLR